MAEVHVDTKAQPSRSIFTAKISNGIYEYTRPVIIDGFWILSHEPLYVNSNMPYANIFGHVHDSPIIKDFSNQHFCVSCERINYAPINFDDIKYRVKNAT